MYCAPSPCPVILDSTCVYYGGNNLPITGINKNDNIQVALQKIDAAINEYNSSYFDNGNSGTAATIDWSKGDTQKITLNSNTSTFTFTNPVVGVNYKLLIKQTPIINARKIIYSSNVVWSNPDTIAPDLGVVSLAIDRNYTQGTGYNGTVNKAVIQSNGKVVSFGTMTLFNGIPIQRIGRTNVDGTFDFSYIPAPLNYGFNSTPLDAVVQSDDKIVVCGGFSSFRGTTAVGIARLLASTATIDASFVTGSGFNSSPGTIAIQSDGKILVGGNFTTYNGIASNRIVRINTDGSFDLSFSIGTGFNAFVTRIAVQPDGKILVGGNFTLYNGTTANSIVRLNSNGSIDSSFNTGTGFPPPSTFINVITLQSDGKILAGGNFTSYNGNPSIGIVRINSNGSYDNTFTPGPYSFSNNINDIKVKSDGKIMMVGTFQSYDIYQARGIAKLNSDGSFDTTFYSGYGFFSYIGGTPYGLIINPDNSIYVYGGLSVYNNTPPTGSLIKLLEKSEGYTTINVVWDGTNYICSY
jgi:uncharacterized delta-60 repeat protein